MQVFFVLKVGGGIGISGRWAKGFMVYNMVNKLSMFHIEYVNCIGEIFFTVDSTTLEEIGKRYQSLQPKSLTSQFTEHLAKKEALEKQLKRMQKLR
jgi:L-2-hydroxyglutarate oxidase LhgO